MSPQPPESFWQDRIKALEAQLSKAKGEQGEARQQKPLTWNDLTFVNLDILDLKERVERFDTLKKTVEKLDSTLAIAKAELRALYRDRNDHINRIEELERRMDAKPSAGKWLLRYFQGPQGVPGVRGEPGPKGEQGEPGKDAVVQSHDPQAVAFVRHSD